MSIINEAIKKARKGFEIKNKKFFTTAVNSKNPFPETIKPTDVRWKAASIASLIFIALLLSSMFLYRYLIFSGRPAVNMGAKTVSLSDGSIELSEIYQKSHFPALKVNSIAELNGIVYGPEDKWAIVNNKIVREGDFLLNGEVNIIARDFVKIKKLDGEEIILELD